MKGYAVDVTICVRITVYGSGSAASVAAAKQLATSIVQDAGMSIVYVGHAQVLPIDTTPGTPIVTDGDGIPLAPTSGEGQPIPSPDPHRWEGTD